MLKQLNGDITSAACLILLREEQQRHKLGKQLLARLLANGGSFALEQQQERGTTLVMRDQFIKFIKYPSEDVLASLTQFKLKNAAVLAKFLLCKISFGRQRSFFESINYFSSF